VRIKQVSYRGGAPASGPKSVIMIRPFQKNEKKNRDKREGIGVQGKRTSAKPYAFGPSKAKGKRRRSESSQNGEKKCLRAVPGRLSIAQSKIARTGHRHGRVLAGQCWGGKTAKKGEQIRASRLKKRATTPAFGKRSFSNQEGKKKKRGEIQV